MKKDRAGVLIGGMTLAGLGVGFMFLEKSPLFFLGSVLIGLAIGLVLSAIVK